MSEDRSSLFDALDLPPEAQPLQDDYWKAKREWESLSGSYNAALRDLLKRIEPPVICAECCRELHGYRGPRCRYCDGTAE